MWHYGGPLIIKLFLYEIHLPVQDPSEAQTARGAVHDGEQLAQLPSLWQTGVVPEHTGLQAGV